MRGVLSGKLRAGEQGRDCCRRGSGVRDRQFDLSGKPAWVHPVHGGSLPADALQGYTTALKSLPFTFDGRLFGRQVPDGA